MIKLIGRDSDKSILLNAYKSNRAELIVVYGRRRIGKTFLVHQVFRNKINFEFSGIYKSNLNDQLKNFHLKLSKKRKKLSIPKDWYEAFHQLGNYLDSIKSNKKKVVFIDEFPWLDTRRSKFLSAFDNFWNSYASIRDDIVIIICGSAASYMINNIIKNKGGLHNRLTEKIQLLPLNLNETELLLKQNKVKLSRYDITILYMALGGVPHYLEKVLPGESVAQALDRLCFQKNGFLRTEFENLFASLFDQFDNHEKVIRALSSVRKGLTRNQILSKTKIASGGRLTKTLTELEESGFIDKYIPYQGSKGSLFRLTDEYSMFYIKYIEKSRPSKSGTWITLQGQQSFKTWSGFSFETICIKHVDQIKVGLKIAGINSSHGSWLEKNKTKGAQLDLLIDRSDKVINVCEMKFYNTAYTINKSYANEIANKTNTFLESTKTRKSLFVTFITTYGLKPNKYSLQLVQNELTLENLFIKL